MIRVAICDDDIVFTTRVEEMILDFGRAYSFEICVYFDGSTLLESMRQGNCFDIIFMDPPYECGLERQVLEYLAQSSLADENTMIIAEAGLHTDFSYADELGYQISHSKEYKTNKHVFLYKRK